MQSMRMGPLALVTALLGLIILPFSRVMSFLYYNRQTYTSWRFKLSPIFATGHPREEEPLFTFGICADIQYVEAPDDYNFQKTKVRRYLQSLSIFKDAVASWKSLKNEPAFAILLGDIVDGKSSQLQNQDKCLQSLLKVCDSWEPERFEHVFGNHEYYAFNRSELHSKILRGRADCSQDKLYYSFSPRIDNDERGKMWKFICMDGYDTSLIGASTDEHLKLAQQLLAMKNPNDLSRSGKWFDGLPREDYRFVPYNGGCSPSQLEWLKLELQHVLQHQQQVVIFCHQPIHAPTKPQSLLWNAEEVKSIIREYGQECVRMWVAGHDHDGNYAREILGDSHVLHHLIPPAPIECEKGSTAYGHIEVYREKMKLCWTGRLPHEKYKIQWPSDLHFEAKDYQKEAEE